MISSKVLADALCDAGILVSFPAAGVMTLSDGTTVGGQADMVVTDWRVAGMCLESMGDNVIARNCGCGQEGGCDYEYDWLRDPRAIINAWYESTRASQ